MSNHLSVFGFRLRNSSLNRDRLYSSEAAEYFDIPDSRKVTLRSRHKYHEVHEISSIPDKDVNLIVQLC
jgi:hypothetical protein